MKTIRVEYDASGGFLHRWRSGTGRFRMAVPPRATDEQIHAAAEAAATEKARKHIDHYNATVSDIRWTSEN
jgi:hypothetical protein